MRPGRPIRTRKQLEPENSHVSISTSWGSLIARTQDRGELGSFCFAQPPRESGGRPDRRETSCGIWGGARVQCETESKTETGMGAVVVLIVCWQIKGGEAGEGKALKTELIWLVQFSRHARERAQNTMKPHPNEQPQILGAGQESGRSPRAASPRLREQPSDRNVEICHLLDSPHYRFHRIDQQRRCTI